MIISNYLKQCFTKDSSVVSRKIVDEFILVPIRQKASDLDSIYTLDEVAAHIWELIDGENSVEDIRDTIVAEFEVSQEVATADLVEFLQQLETIDAIRAV